MHWARFFFVVALFALDARAQKTATWGPVHRTIRYEFRLMNPTAKPAQGIQIYVPLPRTTPRQEIHYLKLSQPGLSRTFEDVHGQRFAHYRLDALAG